MGNNEILNYSLLIFITAIDIFFFYNNIHEESYLYLGTTIHLSLLLFFNESWAERNNRRTMYYVYILSNYLLVIIKYLYPKGIDAFDWDIYGSLIYFIPIFVNYFVSHNIKQLVILDINSMMVVGLSQRGEQLHFWGDDLEGNGIVTLLTATLLIISVFISIILLTKKNKMSSKF